VATAAERLVEVQAAISAVLRNQSFAVNGRSVTRANLGELRQMEKELVVEIARSSDGRRGGIRARLVTPV
jgi:hypothetical protein